MKRMILDYFRDVEDVRQRPSRFAQKDYNWGVYLLSQWKHPEETRSKKAHQGRSNVKVLLIACAGNKEYYIEVMRSLHKAIRQKRKELWKNQTWILHHANSSDQTTMLVPKFLGKKNHNHASTTEFSGLFSR